MVPMRPGDISFLSNGLHNMAILQLARDDCVQSEPTHMPSESQASDEIFPPRNLPFTIALPSIGLAPCHSLLPGLGHQGTLATEDIGLLASKLLPFQFTYYKVAQEISKVSKPPQCHTPI